VPIAGALGGPSLLRRGRHGSRRPDRRGRWSGTSDPHAGVVAAVFAARFQGSCFDARDGVDFGAGSEADVCCGRACCAVSSILGEDAGLGSGFATLRNQSAFFDFAAASLGDNQNVGGSTLFPGGTSDRKIGRTYAWTSTNSQAPNGPAQHLRGNGKDESGPCTGRFVS
jgi:hypothetical protein